MSDSEPQQSGRDRIPASPDVLTFPPQQRRPETVVSFDRRELQTILDLYARRVAEGEWRDYAIDFLADRAMFSIFRRAAETPLYRVVKEPRLARRQGAFSVVTGAGFIVKRGHELARVLAALERRPTLVRR